jgi:hypothetical protein
VRGVGLGDHSGAVGCLEETGRRVRGTGDRGGLEPGDDDRERPSLGQVASRRDDQLAAAEGELRGLPVDRYEATASPAKSRSKRDRSWVAVAVIVTVPLTCCAGSFFG